MDEFLRSLGEWLFILGVGSGLVILALALLLPLLGIILEGVLMFAAIPLSIIAFLRGR